MSAKSPVPRSIRALNGAAVLLFLAGGVLYARAWAGMRYLRDEYVPPPDAEPFSAMAQFNTWWNLSRIGAALVWGALALAIIAAAILVFARRRDDATAAAPDHPTADDDAPPAEPPATPRD